MGDYNMPWGFTDSEWLDGTAETKKILRQTAASRAMISYSELAKEIQSITLDYHSAAMDNMLLEVSHKEWEQGNGLLSVVVVHNTAIWSLEMASTAWRKCSAWTPPIGFASGLASCTECTTVGATKRNRNIGGTETQSSRSHRR